MPIFARHIFLAAAATARGVRRPLTSSSSSPATPKVVPSAHQPLLRKRRAGGDAEALGGFADSRAVLCTGGRGGDGMIAFNRFFCNDMAGPGGGDGGHGGHVVLRCEEGVRDLSGIPPEVRADSGRAGGGSNCHGGRGEHRTLVVPPGTQVLDEAGNLLHELGAHGQVYVAARGGSGGKGNAFFLSNANRAPKLAEYGAAGESRRLALRLRVLADAGLVGYPNAGKSSLLRALSRARPRVSCYPFTTLQPHIGVVHFPGGLDVTVADIPGLIEGAHENRGLGHDFLRHVIRCPCLICVVDLGAEDPLGQLETLRSELDLFSAGMSSAVGLIVANKCDLSYAGGNLRLLQRAAAESAAGDDGDCGGGGGGIGWRRMPPVLPVSAKTGENVAQLAGYLRTFFRHEAHS